MTDDTPIPDPRDVATAGEYVLGTLPRAERIAFQRRLLQDPALRAEVARWESHFDPMADEVRPVSPPDRVWANVENRVYPQPAARAGSGRVTAWRWLAITSTCAALALLLMILSGPWAARDAGDPRDLWVSDMVSADNSVRLTALYDGSDGEMRVSVAGTPPADGRDFELWLIQGDAAPISLGVMPHEGQAAMLVPEDLRVMLADATLAITDEPAGGTPTGVATGPVVAQAVMRRI